MKRGRVRDTRSKVVCTSLYREEQKSEASEILENIHGECGERNIRGERQ